MSQHGWGTLACRCFCLRLAMVGTRLAACLLLPSWLPGCQAPVITRGKVCLLITDALGIWLALNVQPPSALPLQVWLLASTRPQL